MHAHHAGDDHDNQHDLDEAAPVDEARRAGLVLVAVPDARGQFAARDDAEGDEADGEE
jgi:hypothetical protein